MKYVRIICCCVAAGMIWVFSAPVANAAPPTPAISDAQAAAKFVAAAQAYKAEDYDGAIAAYEDILKGGKESGALYYNLGNSYFKKGNVGKAVLNYERARRLIPRDGDLNFNLEYARQLVEQRIRNLPGKVGPGVSLPAQVAQRVGDWTDREIAWVFTGLALAGALIHLASLFGQWPPPWRRQTISLVCVLWLICLGSFVMKLAAEENLAVVITSSDAKFEPREDGTTRFPLGEGTVVKVLRAQDAWAKIKRPDGKVGWAPEEVFERL